jgi:hypothetical protein
LFDPEETQKAKSGRMEITANRSAYFDANTGIAIYRGNVRARHPNASIDCEELEIHMEKDKSGSQGRKKATNDADILASRTEKKAAGASAAQDTGIEVAYARGSKSRSMMAKPVASPCAAGPPCSAATSFSKPPIRVASS